MDRLPLEKGSKILFQGDSVTDVGRSYTDDSLMGEGYPNMIAAWLSARYPSMNLQFINKGISGNRVCDLETRWTEDCISLQPDLVSILIGVNDTWRRYDSNMITPVDDYDQCYRRILDRVQNETSAKLVIMEPFILHTPPDRATWREDLDPRIHAVRAIARDYSAVYVPLDGIFSAAATRREPEFWAADGVHPTQAGHALIAQAWIKAVANL